MNTSTAPLRRSTRAAALEAVARLRHSATSGASRAQASSVPEAEPEKQSRKRQRVTSAAPRPPPTAAAPPAARAKAKAPGPSRDDERIHWEQGCKLVAGVDEAGRGPLAGPVVAAACIIPEHVEIPGVDDSKAMSERQREEAYAALTGHPDVVWAAHVVGEAEIDAINILQAAMRAMALATAALAAPPDFVLVDGNRLPKELDASRARAIVKGDSKSVAIAAASIIAKVTRDRLMLAYHEEYPQYRFDEHKGYGVPAHIEAIRKHGPCPIHRRTFAPVKTWWPPAERSGKAAAK